MRPLLLFLLFAWTGPLLAQPVKIKFVVQSEIDTELTSLTDIHVMTTHGPYNYQDISTMSFLSTVPDSITVEQLRKNGIGVFLKTKYFKPIMIEPVLTERARVAEAMGTATARDSIWIKGNSFRRGSMKLSPKNAFSLMESNPASREEAAMAKSNYNASQLVGFMSGLLIGWPLGQALVGKKDPQWTLAVGGTVLMIASIPLSMGFKKHAEKAMTMYNRKTPATGSTGLSFHFYPGVNGGTVIVRF